MPCATHYNISDSSWMWTFPAVTIPCLAGKKDTTCGSHVQGEQNSHLHCSEACLECVFISCPRTPTAPICSPALLSSSAAASCVVTALCFILSLAVTLRSPGISISCSLVSSFHHHHQHPQPSSCLPMSAGESWAGERKGKPVTDTLLPGLTLRKLDKLVNETQFLNIT